MQRVLAVTCLVSTLAAQEFAAPGGHAPDPYLPSGRINLMVFGDADNDGDQDLCTNDVDGDFSFVRRMSPHAWTTIAQFPPIISAAAWGDFDGDGDRDLLVGASSAVGVLRNNGTAFDWTGQISGVLSGVASGFTVGDLDGDGDLDAVYGAATGVQVLYNTAGTLAVMPGSTLSLHADARPELFDRDGDGDLDLVVASPTGLLLFDNTAGVLTNISGTLPTTQAATVVADDFDQDGRVDLAVTHGNSLDVLWNDPTGWTAAGGIGSGTNAALEVLAGDLDGNGVPDLVLRQAEEFVWFRSLGNRTFLQESGLRGDAPLAAVAVADVTGSGRIDVACAWSDGEVGIFHGGTPSPYADPAREPALPVTGPGPGVSTPAVGDVDGDGRLDLVLPNRPEVVRHVGYGDLEIKPITGARDTYQKAWLADLDGDLDLDLLLGQSILPQPAWQPLQRFVNDGLGNFTPVQDIAMPHYLADFVCADIDGDQDVDILAPTGLGQVLWFENVGLPGFVNSGTINNVQSTFSGSWIVIEDLNGDGHVDIATGRTGSGLPIHLNNGAGGFSPGATVALAGQGPWRIHAVDADNDGDLDLLAIENGQLALFRNDGAANFTRVPGAFPPGVHGYALQTGDIDGDSDVDVLTFALGSGLFANDGTGVFTDVTSRLLAPPFQTPQFLDFDEDGDQDLFAYALPRSTGSWVRLPNRLRDAVSLQAVHPGGALQVRFDAVGATTGPGTVMLPILSFTRGASSSVPGLAGKFQLPQTGSTLVAVLPTATGTATWSLPIPANPAFLSLELCVQSVVLGPNVPPGFTNLVCERILP